MKTNMKITIAGNHISVLETELNIMYGYQNKQTSSRKKQVDPEKAKEIRFATLKKTRSYVKQLINTNNFFWQKELGTQYNPAFITITYRKQEEDLEYSNREFSKFMQRFNYFLQNKIERKISYIAVIEFQKRGAIHYHFLVYDLPYIPKIYDQLRPLWKHGSLNHKSVQNIKHIGNYVCKYMIKDVEDDRLTGRKCYFTSRSIIKPIRLRNSEATKELKEMLPTEFIQFENQFEHEYYKATKFSHYELPYDHPLLQKIHGI